MKMFRRAALLTILSVSACSEGSNSPTGLDSTQPVRDDIPNTVDASVDAVAEVMSLNVGGLPGTTTFYVVPANEDGKNGCNLTGSTTFVATVNSSNTAVATVSPGTITFGSCGDTPTLTVTPGVAGSSTISLTQFSNSTAGSFTLASATFTVNVVAAPVVNTAPTVTISGVTAGGSYNKGSVPVAMCDVTDPEDGPSSFAATLGAITGSYAADGIGSQTASCSYTDGGGITTSVSATYTIEDPSPPTIGYVLTPADPDGDNDWYVSNVTLDWTVTDAESPNSLILTGCVDQNITSDQLLTNYSCSATSAGGSAGPESVSIKRDATAPTAFANASPGPNSYGWNDGSVTVTFTGSDATSGIDSCSAAVVLASEGAGQSASGTCTDNAGNESASAAATDINIDLTDPTVGLVGGPADGGTYYFGFVPAAPTCSASDALSGVAGTCSVSGYSNAIGSHTVMAAVIDKAGNQSTTSVSYTVSSWNLTGFYAPVSMTMLNTVKSGQTVPLKFEIFAGSELTSTSYITSFITTVISCSAVSGTGTDPVEVVSTGGTTLRYDAVEGQFIQNWQTPKNKAGVCYRVTLTTQDGSTLIANFSLK